MFVLKYVYLPTQTYISCCLLNSRVTMVFRLLSDVDPASSSHLLAEYLVFSPTSSSIQDLELDTQISLIHKNDQATKPQHATCHMVTSFGQLEQQDKDHRRVLGCDHMDCAFLLNVYLVIKFLSEHAPCTHFPLMSKRPSNYSLIHFYKRVLNISKEKHKIKTRR